MLQLSKFIRSKIASGNFFFCSQKPVQRRFIRLVLNRLLKKRAHLRRHPQPSARMTIESFSHHDGKGYRKLPLLIITLKVFQLLKYNKRFPVTQELTSMSEWRQLLHIDNKICVAEKVLYRVYRNAKKCSKMFNCTCGE